MPAPIFARPSSMFNIRSQLLYLIFGGETAESTLSVYCFPHSNYKNKLSLLQSDSIRFRPINSINRMLTYISYLCIIFEFTYVFSCVGWHCRHFFCTSLIQRYVPYPRLLDFVFRSKFTRKSHATLLVRVFFRFSLCFCYFVWCLAIQLSTTTVNLNWCFVWLCCKIKFLFFFGAGVCSGVCVYFIMNIAQTHDIMGRTLVTPSFCALYLYMCIVYIRLVIVISLSVCIARSEYFFFRLTLNPKRMEWHSILRYYIRARTYAHTQTLADTNNYQRTHSFTLEFISGLCETNAQKKNVGSEFRILSESKESRSTCLAITIENKPKKWNRVLFCFS